MGGAGAVDADQHLPARPEPRLMPGELFEGGFDDVDVISGGIRAGVPGPQHHLQWFPGAVRAVVDEHAQRVEPEPAFERRLGVLLLRVRPDQGGVHIHDQRRRGIGAVIGCMLTGQSPHRRPGCGSLSSYLRK